MNSDLKNWVMTALTSAFVLLYGAALLGWIKPLADERMLAHLEPLIFVIIGYYFGRWPAQQHEQTLKEELGRQTQKTDAARHAKEQAVQTREALEEKIRNVRLILTSSATSGAAAHGETVAAAPAQTEAARRQIALALSLLSS